MAIRTQQREASAFGGRVAEALQHGEMAVPAADEKKMFHLPRPHFFRQAL